MAVKSKKPKNVEATRNSKPSHKREITNTSFQGLEIILKEGRSNFVTYWLSPSQTIKTEDKYITSSVRNLARKRMVSIRTI